MSKLTKQLQRLFPDFRNYKAKFLNPNTIDVYDDYLKLINTFPNHLDKPSEIRDWLLTRYSAEYSRRILQHIEACYNWAVGSDMAKENPFTKMPNLPKTAYNRREAFSLAERDHIIETFKHENPYWEPFVWFLFKTGCRFEEAVGLQVRHIGPECKFIRFEQAIAASGRVTPIKTGVKRKFPCNDRMQKRLRFITAGKLADSWLFPTYTGEHITASNFLYRHWKPLVWASSSQGRIEEYLPQSHTRHTFITLAMANGMSVQDVSKLVGNRPETIYKHYAAAAKLIEVPDF
jgi:integrase